MPQHPAPPTDLDGLVGAYEQTTRAVIDLGQTMSARDFAKDTECPGWTVKDQFSHIAGIEGWLDGATPPRLDLPELPYVKNEQGEFIELFVQERRSREGADIVGELEDILESRLSQLRDATMTEQTAVRGPFGRTTAARAMTLRASDIWVHEQDIRTAVGRPGDLDSPAAAVFVAAVIRAFPGWSRATPRSPWGTPSSSTSPGPSSPVPVLASSSTNADARSARSCSPASPTTRTPPARPPRRRRS